MANKKFVYSRRFVNSRILARFHIITIFPDVFRPYFKSSILGRAQEKKLVEIDIHDLRNFAAKKGSSKKWSYRRIDDRPYGGGAGMVLMAEPLVNAVHSLENRKKKIVNSKAKVIITSARGKQFTQKMARDWAQKYKEITIISGHYEGIDERAKKILKADEISVGPYILTGGELPAMMIVDAVSRHIPGVLGKQESLEEIKGSYPVYTRPEVIKYKKKRYQVPGVLLGGNHKKIDEWRRRNGLRDS